MKIKKNITRCAFFVVLIFLAYALGYLFLQPYGEYKSLTVLFILFLFLLFYHMEVILLGLGAKSNDLKWSPKTELYSSSFIRSEFISLKSKERVYLIFRDDLSLSKRKEIHESVVQNPKEAFSFYRLFCTSFFFLLLRPIISITNRSGPLRPFLGELNFYFLNPCIEFAMGKVSTRESLRKSKPNFCEEILCHSSYCDGSALLLKALKKSL